MTTTRYYNEDEGKEARLQWDEGEWRLEEFYEDQDSEVISFEMLTDAVKYLADEGYVEDQTWI